MKYPDFGPSYETPHGLGLELQGSLPGLRHASPLGDKQNDHGLADQSVSEPTLFYSQACFLQTRLRYFFPIHTSWRSPISLKALSSAVNHHPF